MATTKPKNLFSTNKFKFFLTGERFKGNQFDLTITGINIPGIQLGIIPMGTHVRQIDRPGDSITFSDLTIEFLITEEFTEWLEIFNWMSDLRDFQETSFDNSITSDGHLVLLTNKSNTNISMTFTDMFPFSLDDLALSLTATDGESIKGTCTFKFNGYSIESNI